MSFSSVLVDGTFRNPLVVFCVLLSAVLLFAAGAAFNRFALIPQSPSRLRQVVLGAVCIGFIVASPVLFNTVTIVIASIAAGRAIGLCLMPTFMPVRDFAPGVMAAAALIWFFFRRHRSHAAA